MIQFLDAMIRLVARAVYGTSTSGCAVAVIDAQGRFAMVRKPGHGWSLPGGFRARGEDAVSGAVRQLYEQTGPRVALSTQDCVVLLDAERRHINLLFVVRLSDRGHEMSAPRARSALGRVLQRIDSGTPTWVPTDELMTDAMSTTTFEQLRVLGLGAEPAAPASLEPGASADRPPATGRQFDLSEPTRPR